MALKTPNTLKQCIAEHYCYAIKELFTKIDNSELIKTSDKLPSILSIGVNSIHRVFEYVLIRKKNIEQANYYTQQACYYFLEYIEQIHKTNLTHSLNNTDAVLFVYKKTIFDLHDGEDKDTSSTMTNILTLMDESIHINDKEWCNMYLRISHVINTLFYWNNASYTFENRKTICDTMLLRYLYVIDKLDFATVYLDNIQCNFQPDFNTYLNLLDAMIAKTEKMRRIRSGSVTEQDKNEQLLTKFSVSRDILKEKYNDGNMIELVSWLYSV